MRCQGLCPVVLGSTVSRTSYRSIQRPETRLDAGAEMTNKVQLAAGERVCGQGKINVQHNGELGQ